MSLHKPMAAISPSLVPLLFFARISGLVVAALVLSWALLFKSSFIPRSSFSSQEDLIYAVLHPLLMVIGFILISGEAILIHRWLPGSRNLKKSVHLCLQGLALGSGVFGIWTKFHGKDGIVANFYSLHSWMGLICVCLFAAQHSINFYLDEMIKQNFWMFIEVRWQQPTCSNVGPYLDISCKTLEPGAARMDLSTNSDLDLAPEPHLEPWLVGFLSFWHRGEVRMTRAKILPWHIFLGLYTYGVAVATAETGLLEKLTFLQTRRNLSRHCPESMIVNSLGLGLVLLCGIVIFTAVSPKNHAVQSKLMYSSDKKCLSS
ncbi:hypothetical protein SCA6_008254 [Theobroma cacao]